MSETGLIQILEGALLAAGKPLTVSQLGSLFEDHERPETPAIREALEQIAQRCDDRGFELLEVASGFRYQVRQSLSPWVARLSQERPQKYSRALLETLALIAYRQPITRGEIEEIRGVAVSSNIVKTLHEREWIRVVGHRDVPGRPAMYATTRQFLDYFNLKNLEQLPALAEIRDLETLNAELGFSEPLQEEGAAPAAQDDGAGDAGGAQSPLENPGLTVVGGTDHMPQEQAAPAQLQPAGIADPAGEIDTGMLLEAVDGLQDHSATPPAAAQQASTEDASAGDASTGGASTGDASTGEVPSDESAVAQVSPEESSAAQLLAEPDDADPLENTAQAQAAAADDEPTSAATGLAVSDVDEPAPESETTLAPEASSDASPDELAGAVEMVKPESQA